MISTWASDARPSLDELEQIHAPQSLLLLLHAVQTSVFGTPAGGAAAALDSSAFMVASRGTSSGNGASRLLESRVSACASAWVCGSGWTCDSTRTVDARRREQRQQNTIITTPTAFSGRNSFGILIFWLVRHVFLSSNILLKQNQRLQWHPKSVQLLYVPIISVLTKTYIITSHFSLKNDIIVLDSLWYISCKQAVL